MNLLYNLASLGLAFIAVLIPIIIIFRNSQKIKITKIYFSSICSLFFCLSAIYFQICQYNYLISIEDWSSLLDTSSFVMLISGLLIFITVLLNIITFIKAKKNGYKTIFY